MRRRRNPRITMLAFIDLEEHVPTAYHLARLSRLVRRRTEGPHGSLIHRIELDQSAPRRVHNVRLTPRIAVHKPHRAPQGSTEPGA